MIHLLGSNGYQSPVVSLKNLGDGGADPFAAIGSYRRRGGGCRFTIAVNVIIIIVVVVINIIVSAWRRNGRTRAFRLDVVHLHPFSRVVARTMRTARIESRSRTISLADLSRATRGKHAHLVSTVVKNSRQSINCRCRFVIVLSSRRACHFFFAILHSVSFAVVADLFAVDILFLLCWKSRFDCWLLSRLINFARD